jgi:hypothetical protein
MWLHASKNREHVRDVMTSTTRALKTPVDFSFDASLVDRMAQITWDNARLIALVPCSMQMFDDAFIIHPVSAEHVFNVSYSLGLLPTLRYVERRISSGILLDHSSTTTTVGSSNGLNAIEAMKHMQTLDEISAFLIPQGTHDKHRQKCLRALGVVDRLVCLAQTPFKEFGAQHGIALSEVLGPSSERTRVFINTLYDVVAAYLTGSSRKNELYISRFIPLFQVCDVD